jgi:hypothetical protein
MKMAKSKAETFVVRFMNVGARRLNWEERIPRPVDEMAIVRAVKKKGALLSREVEAPYEDDWHGVIYAGMREVGRYVIVPNQ